ncbi:ABC transporter ATP-binding protein (plasmid) [Deinococcus radiomollis]|uniref:ABC transporter ATP-binding protein n=1 Tax=Deinococcus radiomollis TaxID=468916 RepID=UPI00389244AE
MTAILSSAEHAERGQPSGEAIVVRGVSKRYGQLHALGGPIGSSPEGVNLELRRGELTALLGPNGAGKSTLIGLMLGLESPSSGSVRVMGGDPRWPQTRTRVGALPQDLSVPAGMTVGELLTLYAALYPRPLAVSTVLELCDLKAQARQRASTLSGGQARRLGFGMSVIGDPDLLFLDEPTVAMDVQSRQVFWAGVGTMQTRGKTIVLTTHYLEEAERVADRVVLLSAGQVIADGTPQQIKAGVRGATVRFVSRLEASVLQALPDVLEVTVSTHPGGWQRATLRTREPERLLAAVFATGAELSELEVSHATLEEAFLNLTAGPKEMTA